MLAPFLDELLQVAKKLDKKIYKILGSNRTQVVVMCGHNHKLATELSVTTRKVPVAIRNDDDHPEQRPPTHSCPESQERERDQYIETHCLTLSHARRFREQHWGLHDCK